MNLDNMVSQVFLLRKGTIRNYEMVPFMNSWNMLIHIAFMRTTVVTIITFLKMASFPHVLQQYDVKSSWSFQKILYYLGSYTS